MKLNVTLHKHTRKEYINEILKNKNVNLLFEDEIYMGNNHNHNWKCRCGNIFKRRWMYIRANGNICCKDCSRNIKDEYQNLSDVYIDKTMSKNHINSLISKWILLEDEVYLGANYKHNWKCKCGNIIENKPWDKIKQYSSNLKCEECQKIKIKERHLKEVSQFKEYEYINSYFSGDVLLNERKVIKTTYLEIKHKYCGSIYTIKRVNFINMKQQCSRCCGKYENSFAYHIEQELKLNINDVWDFEKNTVNPYHINKSYNGKVWIKCQNKEINELNGLKKKDYHSSYEISCNHFSEGKRCSYCKPGGKNPKVHPYDSFGYHHFDKVLSWYPDNDISPFRVARNSNKKYKFICCECGNIFYTYVCNINTQNSWCPECSMSEGENIISNWLRYNGIKYEYEKTYEGLVGINGGSLSYDFYLYEYNLLIEYQGRQHDKYIEGLHSSHFEFERQQEHDKRKREYAKDNNIKLLEIWYYDFDNIEEILNKELNQ